MKKNSLFIVAVLVIAGIAFWLFAKNFRSDQSKQAAQQAPVATSDLIKEHSPKLGPADAKVQIVEFLDPQCEACRAMDPIVKGLLKDYEGKVHFVVRYVPLHPHSVLAAASLEEAREHGKYWEALSSLFFYQPEWGDHHQAKPELIAQRLEGLGIPKESLREEAVVAKHKWKIDQDAEDAKKLGVKGTPSFFINGRPLPQLGYQPLKQAIDSELAK